MQSNQKLRDEVFAQEVAQELKAARQKFPNRPGTPWPVYVALGEEVGELAKALLDEDWGRVVEEAVQVAAMAQRVATEGDPSMVKYRVARGL